MPSRHDRSQPAGPASPAAAAAPSRLSRRAFIAGAARRRGAGLDPGVPRRAGQRAGHQHAAARLPVIDLRVPAGLPELGRHDRDRQRLDLRPGVGRRCGHAGQLGAGQRVPAARQGHEPQLVADRAARGQHRGGLPAGGHHAAPDLGIGGLRITRHRHRGGRCHHGHPDGRAGRGGIRALRHAGARRHHARRPAGHQRARQRHPGHRRDAAGRAELRLAVQPDRVAHRRGLELSPGPVHAEDFPARPTRTSARSWLTSAGRSSPASPCRSRRTRTCAARAGSMSRPRTCSPRPPPPGPVPSPATWTAPAGSRPSGSRSPTRPG